jgi:hypothetical protein
MKDKTLDRRRYRWQLIEKDRERWLMDIDRHESVVFIVARETEEGSETKVWWTVFAPFKKKAISQHLREQDAVKYVEQHLGREEKELRKKEERLSWED